MRWDDPTQFHVTTDTRVLPWKYCGTLSNNAIIFVFLLRRCSQGLGMKNFTSLDGRWMSTCINTEHLWNEAERGKAKYYEKPIAMVICPQWTHMDCPKIRSVGNWWLTAGNSDGAWHVFESGASQVGRKRIYYSTLQSYRRRDKFHTEIGKAVGSTCVCRSYVRGFTHEFLKFPLREILLNLTHTCCIWGLFDRASCAWNKVKCQLDATRLFHWCILSSTCFGYIRPSTGASDVELQHMVFCTEFGDG